jgi:diadenosine tetraphosphate (Ap4A) HIT family hydrolase
MEKLINSFSLHHKLIEDSLFVKDLQLSQLRLLKDEEVPWVLLVPRRENLSEIMDLDEKDQKELISEIAFVSKMMKINFAPDKINIGALGNIVPQLHIHIIARYNNDRAWPGSIWGTATTKKLSQESLLNLFAERIASINSIKN